MATLYTDLLTGITPVMMSQNAPAGNVKDPWTGPWFRAMGRKLLSAVLATPEGPVAVEGKTRQGKSWYSSVSRDVFNDVGGFGAVVVDAEQSSNSLVHYLKGWTEMCDMDMQAAAFGDVMGIWDYRAHGGMLGSDMGVLPSSP